MSEFNYEVTVIESLDKASPKPPSADISNDGVGDNLDFQPLLIEGSSPAKERPIGDCESKAYLQTRLLSEGKMIDDLAVDPNDWDTDEAITFTVVAPAESGGSGRSHFPQGEDSRGLWQINGDPAQTDNLDTFECAELMQWASAAIDSLVITHEGLWLINDQLRDDALCGSSLV